MTHLHSQDVNQFNRHLPNCWKQNVQQNWHHKIQSAQEHLQQLQQQTDENGHTLPQDVQYDLLIELSNALEELQVSAEELLSTRQALADQHQRYQELFEFAPDAYLVTDNHGKILEANQAATALLKINPKYLVGKCLVLFIAQSNRKQFWTNLNQLQTVHQLNDWEIMLQCRAHLILPVSISVSGIQSGSSQQTRLRWLIRDLTERKQTEKLRYEVFHDSLTGLPNRAFLLDRLQHRLTHYHRHPDQPFAVLFLDLDRFKLINDSFGHLIGDQLLITIAKRLDSFLRASDTIARLGGDEFVILLEKANDRHAVEQCVQRIQQLFVTPIHFDDYDVRMTVSIGVVLSHLSYQHPEDLLRDADTAMYAAKNQGRSSSQYFTNDMHRNVLNLLHLEQELRLAIDRQELQVFYQPIVSLDTHQLAGFEALVRWQHPQRGLLAPNEFLSVAEDTGLIILIDWYVLRQACQQIVQWQTKWAFLPPFTISINLSSQQFAHPTLVTQIQSILQQTGINPNRLNLEITESGVVQNVDSAIATLKQLQALSIQVHIDDFGTGLSSLNRLRRLPINALKIDRTFISDPEGQAIIQVILDLAHTLGLVVVCEGVETAAQVEQLQGMGCEYAQGYFYSQPLSVAQWEESIHNFMGANIST